MSGSDAEPRLVDRARAIWRGIALAVMAVLGAAILIALAVLQSNANSQRDRALQLQSHSYDVMILTRTLSGTIARAEAALGRYVISGDEDIGRDYSDQWDQARVQIDRLDAATADNREQQVLIDQLRAAFQRRGSELSVTALSTAYNKDRQAYARFYEAGRSSSLRAIDIALDRIATAEHTLLDKRTATAMKSVARSTEIARVLTIFGVLIVFGAIVLGALTIAAMQERAIARAEADTERERAEQLETAVSEATAALREQEAKLRQVHKMDAVGQLTGGIAHDFNNMLAVVLGGIELAKRSLETNPDAVRRHLDGASDGANRAAALTRRLLAFARAEALHPQSLRPADTIDGMSDLLDRTLGDAVKVERDDDGAGWTIWADRHELENTLLNLAVNARDAMNGRGVLTIRTRTATLAAGEIGHCQAGDHVAVAVADTGCGMTPDVVERVFEPFFTTKPVGKGTGLGLSQIFAFVRQSGGEIAIDSTPGKGTTVTLYLPRHHGAAEAEADAAPEGIAEGTAGTVGLGILLVEDDLRVLAATAGALEELGHRVVPCSNPLEAPAMIASHGPFDLIVSDVLMPEQTGPEMVAGLLEAHPDLAVLFVTGYAGDGQAADFGGRPVLRKPFTIAALDQAIGDAMAFERPASDQLAAA